MSSGEVRQVEEPSPKDDSSSFLSAYRFVVLLIFMTLFLIALPVLSRVSQTSDQSAVSIFSRLFFVGMLIASVFAVAETRKSMMIALALALPTVSLQLGPLLYDAEVITIVGQVFGIIFLLYVVFVLLRVVFKINVVTVDTICASICVYLLLGIMCSLGYSLLEITQPGSFRLSAANESVEPSMRFLGTHSEIPIYYSFITMTTLGYGDIVPTNPASRMLSVLQALTGQLYLVVLVARLVGLQIAHSTGVNTRTMHDE